MKSAAFFEEPRPSERFRASVAGARPGRASLVDEGGGNGEWGVHPGTARREPSSSDRCRSWDSSPSRSFGCFPRYNTEPGHSRFLNVRPVRQRRHVCHAAREAIVGQYLLKELFLCRRLTHLPRVRWYHSGLSVSLCFALCFCVSLCFSTCIPIHQLTRTRMHTHAHTRARAHLPGEYSPSLRVEGQTVRQCCCEHVLHPVHVILGPERVWKIPLS